MTQQSTASQDGASLRLLDPAVRSVTIGATALIALFAVEYVAVGTAMPTVSADLDGLDLYALAFGATIAASVIGMILGGWWCDRSGPGPVIAAGCAAFAGGLLVAGAAPTMEIFVIGRGVQGLGSGLAMVAVYVVIAQGIPDRLRPQMFSLLAAAWVLPGLAGPLVTGFVVQHFSWRWAFLGVIPVVALAFAVLLPGLRGTRETENAPYLGVATILWAVLAAVSVGVLNLGGEEITAGEVLIGLPFALGLGLAAWRLLPAGTLSLARGLPSVIATRGAIGAAFMGAEAYLPLMLQERHGWSPTQAGGALAVGAVSWAAGSWLQGRRGEVDRYRLMLGGCVTVLAGTVGLLIDVLLDWPGWSVLVIWGVTLLGVGVAFPTTSLLTMRLSPREVLGRNSSSLTVSEALASAVTLAAVGAAFTALYSGSKHAAFVAVVAGAVIGATAAVATSARSRPVSAE